MERLTESQYPQIPTSWHPSGRYLAFHEEIAPGNLDIWILPMEGDEASGWRTGKLTAFLNTPFRENEAVFSPDGRWLAYESNESGREEIYVRPFPGPGGKWQVSTGDARNPTWSRNRKELLYRTAASPTSGFGMMFTLMVAPYEADKDSFRAERPRQWSPGRASVRGPSREFDLHPDGRRVAVLKAADQQGGENQDHVVFVENFFEELKRLVPTDNN